MADVLRRAIGRTEELIDRLLVLARAGEPLHRREEVDLADAVRRAVAARAGDIESRGLRTVLELEPAALNGDPVLIDSLVANLVDNAIRHNRGDGLLRVSTLPREGVAVLRVENDGLPVPSAEVDWLFERFTRLERSRSRETGGHGLGLAIVRAIARAHGGAVHASARDPGGLTIEVAFPTGS
jgi:signal transduction histidine kinase